MKFCPLCQRDLLLSKFDLHVRGASGVYHCCSNCRKKNDKRPAVKWCNDCKSWKRLDEYNKNTAKTDGLFTFCRNCSRARCRASHLANPMQMMAAHFRRTYGITLEQYEVLWAQQNGLCAICGQPETEWQSHKMGRTKRLAVDHCHQTGEVRALLCGKCNQGLGVFKDDAEILRKAAAYLESCKRGR
jgi:hypothetical protein